MTGQRKKRIAGSYFVSTLSISLVLVVVGILVFILLNAKLVSDHVKQNIGFSIIVKDNVNEAEIKKMQKILDTKPFVSSSVFISKVEAAREFKEELGEDFEGVLGYNPLLPSVEIKLNPVYANNDSLTVIEKSLLKNELVQEVSYQKSLVHMINENVRRISLILLIAGAALMLISFSLLGIGNALMQTSLNPLLSNIVRGDRLASSLTFGQFVKAIASFLAPYIAMWGATQAIPSFGLGWRVLFPIYMIVAIIAIFLLNATQIEEEKEEGRPSTFGQCLALLGKPFILLCFIGIMCHVGIDVGTNTTAPKILMERIGMTLDEAAFATSLYFIFRTAGCFLGSFILRKMSPKSFFGISVVMMLVAMAGLFIFHEQAVIYACIALIGFGNSNVFSVIFSQALLYLPGKKNEVSGLMIMGLFGGTVFPLAMGVASDTSMGQNGAIAVMTVGVLYLLYYTFRIKK